MPTSREIIYMHMLRPDQVLALGGLCTYLENADNPVRIGYSRRVAPENERSRRAPFARPLYRHVNRSGQAQPVSWMYQFGSTLVRSSTPPPAELTEFCTSGISLLDADTDIKARNKFVIRDIPTTWENGQITNATLNMAASNFRNRLVELEVMFAEEARDQAEWLRFKKSQ